YTDALGNKQLVDKNDFSIIENNEKVVFDIAFIMMHGSPGEDGRLVGYFEMLGIPFTGCGVLSAAVTMNKDITKKLVADVPGLKVAKSFKASKSTDDVIAYLSSNLKLPYIMKPNNGGSSIGMAKITHHNQVEEKLAALLKDDKEVLIEEFISG